MPSGEAFSDEELLARSRSASEPAVSRELVHSLFERYHRKVAVWCLRLTGDRESAADLAQDVFLKATVALDGFEGKSKFSTWLYSIARNHCFNSVRSAQSRIREAEPEELESLADDSGQELIREIESRDSRKAFRELLNRELSETEKRVLVLHYVEDFPLAAVTRALALDNPSGAKAYIVSAKRKLKRALAREKARSQRQGGGSLFSFPGKG